MQALEYEKNTEKRLDAHEALNISSNIPSSTAQQTLKDPQLNKRVKSVMLKALLAAGLRCDICSVEWQSKNAEDVAKMLFSKAVIDASKITNAAVASAIWLAHQVAETQAFLYTFLYACVYTCLRTPSI